MFAEDFVAIAISSWSLLAQEAPAAPEATTFQNILANPLTPIIGLFFLFYFIYILPERRRKADEATRMSSLKKNDRVVTIGGIHGTIVSTSNDDKGVVTMRIDDSTRMKINRSAIATIISDKESQDGKNKETASDTKDK